MGDFTGEELIQAAIYDREELLKCLLEGECLSMIDTVDRCNRTALYTAVSNNSLRCLKLLLEHGANPNIQAGEAMCNRNTALHCAMIDGKKEMVELLIKHGADLYIPNRMGLSPLSLARNIGREDFVKALEFENNRREIEAKEKRKEYIDACERGDIEEIETCLKNTGRVRLVNEKITEDGLTALCLACKLGDHNMVKLLLDYEADPRVLGDTGQGPAHIVCQIGNSDILLMLLKQCPDIIQQKTADEQLPIHFAVWAGNHHIVKTIFEFDYPENCHDRIVLDKKQLSYMFPFDMNTVDIYGQSLLNIASKQGSRDIVEYLLNFTVSVTKTATSPTSAGMSDSDESPDNTFKGDSFRYCPIRVTPGRNSRHIPLLEAIKNKFYDIMDLLLQKKADPNSHYKRDGKIVSALSLACDCKDSLALDKLLQAGAEDVGLAVFNKAAQEQQNLIPILLKYRSIKNQNLDHTINKSAMRSHYLRNCKETVTEFTSRNSTQRMMSFHSDFKKTFPVNAVHLRWQDLKLLTHVEEEWLMNCAYLHNPAMSSINSPYSLYAITKIDLSGNNLGRSVPKIFFRLPSLYCVNLSKNKLENFPQEGSITLSCDCLEEIRIDNNRFETLPTYLFSLPKLKVLSVASNYLHEVPAEIWSSSSLIILNLSDNKLSSLPEPKSGNVPDNEYVGRNTPSMSLSESDFEFESSHIGTPDTQVRHASYWCSRLQVKETDFDITNHPDAHKRGLQDLDLSKNLLTEVPHWLCCCAPYMENLNLSENRIVEIMELNMYPQHLKTLDLSINRFSDLSSWQLVNDETAWPCYSHRGRKDSGLTSYQSMQQVFNCPHRSHSHLERLDTLNLSNNRYLKNFVVSKNEDPRKNSMSSTSSSSSVDSLRGVLPGVNDEAARRLIFPNLTSLDLSCNASLTKLPTDLGHVKNLKRLSLSRSKITELPPELGCLKHLITLDVELCPLEGPIQDIIKSSNMQTRDILGFLHSILEEAVEYNCMNLMFVGLHDIGKTTLLQQIRKNRKIPKGIPPPSHWIERRDKTAPSMLDSNKTLSTVGIDINEVIVGEKREHGPVTFRTWDFGGQKEYYATHQYFLSARSLYLVMWKITDGEKGVHSMWQWLVNIQARAPGSPVIIIGTHRDVLYDRATRNNFTKTWEEDMNKLIEEQFIQVEEPDKCGLPNVISSMNISTKNKDDINKLVNFIYKTVFDLRHPRRRTERLLRHKIPKKYLLLKEIVQDLAREREEEKKDPVLDKDSYLLKTMHKMLDKAGSLFRDVEDVEQATRFLHETGILFHYEDIGLKDLYFLNPQWLCDQLAQVVTVDQVNKFSRNGVMEADNLRVLFNRSTFQPENIERYICGLLGKFEVALEFDRNRLLLPSLLPTEQDMCTCISNHTDVKISMSKSCLTSDNVEAYAKFPFHASMRITRGKDGAPTSSIIYRRTPQRPSSLVLLNAEPTSSVIFSHCRLYVMTYFPSGFWPRLITRILADSTLSDIVNEFVPIPEDILESCSALKTKVPKWQPWQTGLKLIHYDATLFCIKEVLSTEYDICRYNKYKFQCFLDDIWTDIDMVHSVILEISFPSDSIIFSYAEHTAGQDLVLTRKEQVYVSEIAKAKFLTKITAHVDNLLHDWYPDLGESRFNQNCYGRYLITRIVPCPHCLQTVVIKERVADKSKFWQSVNMSDLDNEIPLEMENCFGEVEIEPTPSHVANDMLYCFVVERSIVNFLCGYNEICPRHGSVSPTFVMTDDGIGMALYSTPDVVFSDIDNGILVGPSDHLTLDWKLGKGGFGDVYAGKLRRIDEEPVDVAVKILFASPKESLHRKKDHLYMQRACDAYLTARQEVSILQEIQHKHIVSLLGLCTQPLGLVLDLAPHGSVGDIVAKLKTQGQDLSVFTIKQIILQVADALAYLHYQSVIYRDLKADNVLVWQIPVLDHNDYELGPVLIKLADYGISRAALPSGTKGFGGTPPFIAPEILQYAGKNTYTEKVDIFSFGMFIYELLTCSKPLEDVTNPTLFICQYGRPHVTSKQKHYPCHFLDLMCMCWAHDPSVRPSAVEIKQVAGCAQFCHLADAVSLDVSTGILTGCSVSVGYEANSSDFSDEETEKIPCHAQVWLSTCVPNGNSCLEIYKYDTDMQCSTNKTLLLESSCQVNKMVAVEDQIWCVDNKAVIHVYDCRYTEEKRSIQLNVGDTNQILCGQYYPSHNGGHLYFVFKSNKTFSLLLVKVPVSSSTEQITTTSISSDSKSYCACVVAMGARRELWVGQSVGMITVVNINDPREAHKKISHFGSSSHGSNRQCTFLEVNSGSNSQEAVWSYVYPGTNVYRWNSWTKQLESTLNCSHVVPASEGYQIYSNPAHFDVSKYQVTALIIVDKYLYVGTTWGCIIVANSATLQVYTAFRCHKDEEFYIRCILPLHQTRQRHHTPDGSSVPGIVSVGKGYNSLLSRDSLESSGSGRYPDNRQGLLLASPQENNTFILSWFAKHWEHY